MFNIELILGNLSDRYTPEMLNNAIQNLVKQGILEQYTDEDGDFQFQITEFGIECAEEILKDPESFIDREEEDDMAV
jgi:predicted transcriptional regulator